MKEKPVGKLGNKSKNKKTAQVVMRPAQRTRCTKRSHERKGWHAKTTGHAGKNGPRAKPGRSEISQMVKEHEKERPESEAIMTA